MNINKGENMTLVNGVPMPGEEQEEQKIKPRGRRKKKEVSEETLSLIEALKFVSVAQSKKGTPEQQFSIINNNWIAASNGIITAATKIKEDLSCCPHTFQMLDALKKCEGPMNITQLSEQTISVKSGAFQGLIPCISMSELRINGPDEQLGAIDNRVKEALKACHCLVMENAPNAIKAAVLLQSGSAVATDEHALIEYWHGHELPREVLIPKVAAAAIGNCKKHMKAFGLSTSSFTAFFEDDSFIKTQLYNEHYPNYKEILNIEVSPWPLPDEFFKAVKAIESFAENSIVYFQDSMVCSKDFVKDASTYELEGLPDNAAFNSKYILKLQKYIGKVQFEKVRTGMAMYYFSENARGVIMGMETNESTEESEEAEEPPASNYDAEDVPF